MYSANIEGKRFTFGVSGKLYENNVLLYDRQTESLWLQLQDQAVTGKMAGTQLKQLPFTETTWAAWKEAHPNTLVLSDETGYARDYGSDPYGQYAKSRKTIFPSQSRDDRYHPKEKVLGLVIDNTAKAYPFSEFPRERRRVTDSVEGVRVVLTWDPTNQTLQAMASDGNPLPSTIAYWFAWSAFHPDTLVYTASKPSPPPISPRH